MHRLTPGSIGRQEWYRQFFSGSLARDGSEDPAVKVALHYAPDGTVDGYVSYKFSGWDTEPYTMDVVDLVAARTSAAPELWQFLGPLTWWNASPGKRPLLDDLTGWALEDPRCIDSSDSRDMLWLRILDVQRRWNPAIIRLDGRLVLEVRDPLGLTAGTFALAVTAEPPSYERRLEPDLTLDVSALSSIYLGAVPGDAGRRRGGSSSTCQGAALRAARMFAVERATHCLTHF